MRVEYRLPFVNAQGGCQSVTVAAGGRAESPRDKSEKEKENEQD